LQFISKRNPKKLFWVGAIGPMTACLLGVAIVMIAGYDYLGAPIKTVYNIPRGENWGAGAGAWRLAVL
jgi:hypothetical protein